jgi:hypothetical protein
VSPRCPWCRAGEAALECPGCGAPLHAGCALEQAGCAACGAAPGLGALRAALGPDEGWQPLGGVGFARAVPLEEEAATPRRLRLELTRAEAAADRLLPLVVEVRGGTGSAGALWLAARAPGRWWARRRWRVRLTPAARCARWELRLAPPGPGPLELVAALGGARAGLRVGAAVQPRR